MKLREVDATELRVFHVFGVTCFMCGDSHYVTGSNTVGEAIAQATLAGWHGYETDGEMCSTACPKCIKEVEENEAEDAA